MNRSSIDAVYAHLLDHHKLLLEATRADYEREHGPIAGPSDFLQLLINHEHFAWLRPFTGMLVEIDDPKVTPDGASARAKVEQLFDAPVFQPRYDEVRSLPDVARSHAKMMELLTSLTAN